MRSEERFASAHVLLVEDEDDAAELLVYGLQREGFQVERVAHGEAALVAIDRRMPDVVLLDRLLPGVSGDDVLRRLRSESRTARLPVIMVTAKVHDADQLVGFALGADDYIGKPVSVPRLAARIGAVLRRRTEARERRVIEAGPLRLDPERHEVSVAGRPASLTLSEFRILAALMEARGRVVDRSRLLEVASDGESAATERTVDVHVAGIRRKLGRAGEWLWTIRGLGYRLEPPAVS
jgi:DNA-binding response OmpR family regulator